VHPPTHLALSWLAGCRLQARRDRVLVAWAGLAPDLDGLTLLAGVEAYGRWHHVLSHGLAAALVCTALVAVAARERVKTALLALAAFHLHLVCDLLGSGREWGIVYLHPQSDFEYFTPFGWPLPSWQNMTVTALALLAIAWQGITRGRTFVEALLPRAADAAVVEVLRRRFARLSRRPHAALAPR
jgi:hypothetical protein